MSWLSDLLVTRLTAVRAGFLDKVAMVRTVSTHTVTVAHGTNETTVTGFPLVKGDVTWGFSIYLDLATLVTAVEGGTVTVRYYQKTDAAHYALIGKSVFVVGTETIMPSCEVMRGYNDITVTIQCSAAVTGNRIVPFVYIITA